jgi:putative membrane protein
VKGLPQMNNSHNHGSAFSVDFISIVLILFALIFYILAGYTSNRQHKKWPVHRYFFWGIGLLCVALAIVGPIATRAHHDFTAHMAGHLLLGMLGPLLIALSAPMTLILRTLKVTRARQLIVLLKIKPVRVLSNPIVAACLNFGGLWVLYTTDLYALMQHYLLLHLIVHIHVFLAGLLFTVTMVYIDPVSHRYSYIYRSVVLILSLASHGILSKYIYAYPPAGVAVTQAEHGAMLMYYGGDIIDLLLIWLLCYQWYKSTRTRSPVGLQQ